MFCPCQGEPSSPCSGSQKDPGGLGHLSILNKAENGGKPANFLTVPTALADFPVLYWEILWGKNCSFRRSLTRCSQTFGIRWFGVRRLSAFADLAFTDSALADSAFADLMFTDSTFADSTFADLTFTVSTFADSTHSLIWRSLIQRSLIRRSLVRRSLIWYSLIRRSLTVSQDSGTCLDSKFYM